MGGDQDRVHAAVYGHDSRVRVGTVDVSDEEDPVLRVEFFAKLLPGHLYEAFPCFDPPTPQAQPSRPAPSQTLSSSRAETPSSSATSSSLPRRPAARSSLGSRSSPGSRSWSVSGVRAGGGGSGSCADSNVGAGGAGGDGGGGGDGGDGCDGCDGGDSGDGEHENKVSTKVSSVTWCEAPCSRSRHDAGLAHAGANTGEYAVR